MLYLRHNIMQKMMLSAESKILTKIKKAKRDTLFFISDFVKFGSAKTVSKALQRLVNKLKIQRVVCGIYARLRKSEFGEN